MKSSFSFLVEKEEMWAKMLVEVLKDNGIPCVAESVYGSGLVFKTGLKDIWQVLVPDEYLQEASELVEALFSEATDE